MSARRIVGLVLLGALLRAEASDAAVLCRSGAGKLSLREKCRKAEQVLDASQLDVSALTGPPGGPGEAGPRGQHPLQIVDSAGVEIGPIQRLFLGAVAYVAVTHPALTATVQFYVGSGGFIRDVGGGANRTVYYAAADCAGVPHVRTQGYAVLTAQVYGDSAYYEAGPSESRSVMSSEIDFPGDPCTGGAVTTRGTCCFNAASAFTDTNAPAIRVPLADLGFVPPFGAVLR
jgi:hypothetical protein